MAEQHLDQTEFTAAWLRFMQIQQQHSNASQPSEIHLLQGNERFEDTVGDENHDESGEESIANINELRQQSDDEEGVSGNNTSEFEETETYNVESFIDAIRDYVCIWNTSLRSYHELTKRKAAWENLSRKYGKSDEFLKNQWKNLRDCLKRCLVKREQQTKSGAGAQNLSTCKYFKQLSFIHDKVMNKKTESNLVLALGSSSVEKGESPLSSDSLPSPPLNQANNLQTPSPPLNQENNLQSPSLPLNQANNLQPPPSNQARHLHVNAQKENDSRNVKLRNPTYIKRKRREEISDKIDCVLLKTLSEMKETSSETQNMPQNTAEDVDADFMFCKSLIPILKKLTAKKNGLAKIKIQALLYEIEFEEKV